MNDAYLRRCHRGNDSLCPIFRLGDIVREAGEKFSEMSVEVSLQVSYTLALISVFLQPVLTSVPDQVFTATFSFFGVSLSKPQQEIK